MSANRLAEPADVVGESLTPVDSFWLEMGQSLVSESITSIEEAARQVIAIASLAQAVYFAAVSFSTLRQAMAQFGVGERLALALLLVSPLVCWVLALFFAVRVFKPEEYGTHLKSPSLIKDMYHRVVNYKQHQLQWAYWFLALGFAPLVVNILLAFVLIA